MRKKEEILAELFREFPEEERMILGLPEKDTIGYLLLGSQNWATQKSVLRAFKERHFQEVQAAQKKAERLFALGLELIKPDELV